MNYRPLGSSGITVSEVGSGTWAVGGQGSPGNIVTGWGEVSDESVRAALETAYEL